MRMSHTPYHAEIRPYQGRATIFINDQPQSPLMYCLCAASGSEPWTEAPQRYFAQFVQAGYRILGIDTWLHHVWRPGEPIDVGYVQRQVRAVLNVCPDAFVLIRINVSAPAW